MSHVICKCRARLEARGNRATDCGDEIMQLKSACSNGIDMYFADNCRAIGAIKRKCTQPAAKMLTSLGFTAEEENILRDSCASAAGPASSIAVVARSLAATADSPMEANFPVGAHSPVSTVSGLV